MSTSHPGVLTDTKTADTKTADTKMMYLIKRRPGTGRDEMVAHWFANHMPLVIAAMDSAKAKEQLHAKRYVATLFNASKDGDFPWDGVAQLWWPRPLPQPDVAHGVEPTDSFQQKVEPYLPWATTEYTIIDGAEKLPVVPLTLNAPFPTTRSGFCKITFLVRSQSGINYADLFDHWLNVHAPNVAGVMREVGGFHYVVSHSIDPEHAPYAGMAELYFPDTDGWRAYKSLIKPDGMEQWTTDAGTLVLRGETEMIGIP